MYVRKIFKVTQEIRKNYFSIRIRVLEGVELELWNWGVLK